MRGSLKQSRDQRRNETVEEAGRHQLTGGIEVWQEPQPRSCLDMKHWPNHVHPPSSITGPLQVQGNLMSFIAAALPRLSSLIDCRARDSLAPCVGGLGARRWLETFGVWSCCIRPDQLTCDSNQEQQMRQGEARVMPPVPPTHPCWKNISTLHIAVHYGDTKVLVGI